VDGDSKLANRERAKYPIRERSNRWTFYPKCRFICKVLVNTIHLVVCRDKLEFYIQISVIVLLKSQCNIYKQLLLQS